jgi:thiamine-phosphate pyrophosphorylase
LTQLKKTPDPLCAIVDATVAERCGWSVIDLATAYLNGGARFLQLRAKNLPGGEFLALASAVVELAHGQQAVLVVNDRADIARLAGADGVHVGQEDLAPRAVRRLVGKAALIGLSTHTMEQLDTAAGEGVDYVAIGPVFGTTTKATGYEAVGLERVREAADRAARRGLPLVAIGGITLETAASVIQAGAASVAVISDLLSTGDPERRVREFLTRLNMYNPRASHLFHRGCADVDFRDEVD